MCLVNNMRPTYLGYESRVSNLVGCESQQRSRQSLNTRNVQSVLIRLLSPTLVHGGLTSKHNMELL